MRKSVVALALTALSAAATAQSAPAWEAFDGAGGMTGIRVKSAAGQTLVVKCDKPGRREVYAMVLSPGEKLAVVSQAPPSRPIRFQFDAKSPTTENWRFYETYATALGKTGDRALAHFIVDLRNASKVEMRLNTGIASDVVMNFDVTGAGDAIKGVYDKCKDSMPA